MDSPVIKFMRLTWEATCKNGANCWEKINNSMQESFLHCVRFRFKFNLDDVTKVIKIGNSRRGSWLYDGWAVHLYREAIIHENPSAVRAFERYLEMESPFWGRDVQASYPLVRGLHGDNIFRKKERLAPGLRFAFRGETWECTSFSKCEGGFDMAKTPPYINAMCGKRHRKFTREMLSAEIKEKESAR